jgi:hypothetical protein
MFRKQFILTKEESFGFDFHQTKLGDLNLFFHEETNFSECRNEHQTLILLGNIYSYQKPEWSNQDIVNNLFLSESKEDLFNSLSSYCGEFILLYKNQEDYILFNDASAQLEIYYDSNFNHFGSQPKILENVVNCKPHSSADALDFYNSKYFKKKSLFLMDTTHYENIHHLMTNQYIDLKKKEVIRYFPTNSIERISLDKAAEKVVFMLNGFMQAFAHRSPLAIAVTGGYDSRILFLLSLNCDAKYFVLNHPHMGKDHFDVTIPSRLTNLYNKDFQVLQSEKEAKSDFDEEFLRSVDFPRAQNIFPSVFKDRLFINGNISEVAREFFGYMDDCSGKDLAFLSKYDHHPFPSKLYQEYRDKNRAFFDSKGIHWLSMFYWEERMGNWVSKAKTEANALGISYTSPFNCREIITTMWGVSRKDRDFYRSKLHAKMLQILSSPEALKIPINPSPKLETIRWMKRLKLYNFYRLIGRKLKKY